MDIFALNRRKTIRAPINPLDKSTIVSIYPREITERKATIQPGRFTIPAGSFENPGILVVGPSSWWREIDPEQPLLEIPISSISIADSIVTDYANGLLACDMGEKMPGIFYVPGELNCDQVKKTHLSMLIRYKNKQDNWFRELIKIADVMWSRSNGSPLAISDDARMAASALGIQRDWLQNYQNVEMTRCIACGSLRNPNFPVCTVCKAVVDQDKATKLNLKFAQ